MKKWLKEKLSCPECLNNQAPLDLDIKEELSDDVMEGELRCTACGRCYPINKGVAVILPEKSMSLMSDKSGYNSQSMLSSYLWSHFSELFNDPDATDAYKVWSSYFRETDGYALDIGCSVGRLSFELSKTHSHVIGIDSSVSFVTKARELLNQKRLDFDLIIEGFITEKRSCDFDASWNYDRIDFIVADALALPFPKSSFSTVTSINILEKVPSPIRHLADMNRVLNEENSMLVFSDPFSWDETVSASELWLGGTPHGKYKGRGIDNISKIFSGEEGIFDPPLEIADKGNVSWKIRKTENLWEHINSQFIVGTRK
ncbi:class I SAM-dependent methyltransferase [Desulfonema magnum]|uniref:SAM-dependent methyltransferase, type 11 n=1 Tax=Desulfonema magnum TaxID=45655 RepID=A0A975GLM7_9BACT|nr:methyltransferase domain-containing protein [Desulfonema magnum]QTA85784.1 SAM-dependent methyltransferase, type 11 [Desulfonema magnum]